MKGCIIISLVILCTMMAICIMVKFAADVTEKEPRDAVVYVDTRPMGVIPMIHDNTSLSMSARYPYIAAVTRNSLELLSFACFASIVLFEWIVTSAHCRHPGATHRVLLFQDFAHNDTTTYLVLLWHLHARYNSTDPTSKFDIAVAKINVQASSLKSAVFNENRTFEADAAVWKTVSTMDQKVYLTNQLEILEVRITNFSRCYEDYGVESDDSLICIDLSDYKDCFVNEFGPIFIADKVVGILAVKPPDCDMKLAIFTNVSYYSKWILESTQDR